MVNAFVSHVDRTGASVPVHSPIGPGAACCAFELAAQVHPATNGRGVQSLTLPLFELKIAKETRHFLLSFPCLAARQSETWHLIGLAAL